MPDQAAIVQELYNRLPSLPPDKAAIVTELARRFGVGDFTPGGAPPDAGAQMRASALAKVPPELRGYTPDELAHSTGVVNPFGGPQPITTADMVNNPYTRGVDSITEGAAQLTRPGFDAKAGGASKIIRGAGGMVATPALVAGAVLNPLGTAAGVAGGYAAGKLAHAGLEAAGAGPGTQDLGEDVANLAGGSAAGHYAGQLAAAVPKPGFRVQLDPAEASAVAYGDAHGVQMPTSVRTGSKVAANAENILQNLPLSSSVAKAARANEQSTLAAAGNREVQSIAATPSGEPATPLDAGEALHYQLDKNIAEHNTKAGEAYDQLRSIEAQPQFKATVQTGTKLVDGGIDENGASLYKRVPVVEDVQLPVALRPVKEALRPIYDRLMRQMPVAQQQASAGLKAISNIVNGPDFESASITDENLGAIKQIAREANSPVSQGLAKAAVQQLDAAVQQAVARAGPDAVAALQQGRAETIAKYASQSVKDSLGLSADNPEPAAAVAKLTQPGDKSINLLRSVAEETPEHIPLIAQSLVSGLLDKVTAEAGQAKPQSALTAWQKIGDQTKQVLFQSPEKVQALNDFFTLAKKMGENPNPSGSGQLLALVKGVGLVVTSPATAIPWILGAKPLARLLFTPTGARNLILASKLPAVGSGAIGARLADSILAGAGKDGVTPVTANAGAGTAAASPAAVDATQSGRGAATPAASSPLAAGSTGSGRAASGHVPAEAGAAAGTVGGARSADTVIPIPGESGRSYQARYQFVERRDLVGSHNGNNFQPDPRFPLKNDRQYKTIVNQGKIVNGASRKDFNPDLLVNDNPDATNGPPVTDEDNVTLAGNGRKAILDRVYSGNPQGAAAYRALLAKKAAQFGLDPSDLAGMDEPVLVRKIANSEFKDTTAKQNAITDFNKTGTAALTPAERAIADSRRVSTGTLDDVAARLDEKGPDATMGDVLEGKGGGEILQKLITDGVVSPQEQAAFVNSATNELTKAGRERIGQLMIGRFFSDPAQMESAAPSVRARIERMAAPLAQVEAKGDWNLTPDVQTAVDLLDAARRQGIKSVTDFVAQDGLFGKDKYSPQAIAIAKALQSAKSAELTKAARQYAQDAAYADQGRSLLGDTPTPKQSFDESFGALKSGAQVDAETLVEKGKAAIAKRRETQKGSLKIGGDDAAPEVGPHGPIFREFSGKPAEAIQKLIQEKNGAVPDVWSNPNVPKGKIGLAWGKPGDPAKDWAGGYGLSHIIAKHVEAQKDFNLEDLADLVPKLKPVSVAKGGNRLVMETPDHRVIVSLDWLGKEEHWVITAFEPRK